MAHGVLRSSIAGHDGVDGTATINLPGGDRIPLRTMIDIQYTRHDALGDVGTSQRGATISYPAVRMILCKYLDKAGLSEKGYTLHRLRHTFASELLNAGMRLECLQKLLGHTSLEVTRRYARLTDKKREEEYFRAMEIIEKDEADGDD